MPPRAAFVRSGELIGVIYTNETPEAVSEVELDERLDIIQEQTRAKYCHPKAEVEQAFMPTQPPSAAPKSDDATLPVEQPPTTPPVEPPVSRWEEI